MDESDACTNGLEAETEQYVESPIYSPTKSHTVTISRPNMQIKLRGLLEMARSVQINDIGLTWQALISSRFLLRRLRWIPTTVVGVASFSSLALCFS